MANSNIKNSIPPGYPLAFSYFAPFFVKSLINRAKNTVSNAHFWGYFELFLHIGFHLKNTLFLVLNVGKLQYFDAF